MASSSGRQPISAALNRGCHLCLAGPPSRWALAHISGLFTAADARVTGIFIALLSLFVTVVSN